MTPEVTWDSLDWSALDRLRARFLGAVTTGDGSYWEKPSDLANYDFTFGQRIGWKWDAVLRELRQRGWTPPVASVLDWGCGSGVAGRRFLQTFGTQSLKILRVFDRAPMAAEFAAEKARREFPGLTVEQVDGSRVEGDEPPGIVLLSHVLNELTIEAKAALRRLLCRAVAIVWVEAGTREISRELGTWRDSLLEEFLAVAPCTHQARCGILAAGNERHWCHHFAAAPAGIMADSHWVRFAQRAGIDLRSLPYSFLVMERRGDSQTAPGWLAKGFSRIIGEPRVYKGFARILSCQTDGVCELRLQRRVDPELFRSLKDGSADPVYRWYLRDSDIEKAEALSPR